MAIIDDDDDDDWSLLNKRTDVFYYCNLLEFLKFIFSNALMRMDVEASH